METRALINITFQSEIITLTRVVVRVLHKRNVVQYNMKSCR